MAQTKQSLSIIITGLLVLLTYVFVLIAGPANADVADGTIPAGFADDTVGKDPIGWDWASSGQSVKIDIFLDDGWDGKITAIEVFIEPAEGDPADFVQRLADSTATFPTGRVLTFTFSTAQQIDRDLPTPMGIHLMGLGTSGSGYVAGNELRLLVSDGPTNTGLLVVPAAPTATPGPTATPVTITEIPIGNVVVVNVPAGGTVTIIQPSSASTITTPDGAIVVQVPAVAHDTTFQIAYDPSPSVVPPTPANLSIVRAFGLNAHDADGIPISLSLRKSVTIVASYTAADALGAPNGNPSNLKIARYDSITSAWVTLNTNVDLGAKTLTAKSGHLSLFAVVGAEPSPQSVGTVTPTATAEPPPTGDLTPSSGLLLGLMLVGFLLMAAGATYMAQNKRSELS